MVFFHDFWFRTLNASKFEVQTVLNAIQWMAFEIRMPLSSLAAISVALEMKEDGYLPI